MFLNFEIISYFFFKEIYDGISILGVLINLTRLNNMISFSFGKNRFLKFLISNLARSRFFFKTIGVWLSCEIASEALSKINFWPDKEAQNFNSKPAQGP